MELIWPHSIYHFKELSEREKCKRDRERVENERDKTVIEGGRERERKNRDVERE